jgi:Polysulphide reductase, NrfD
MVPKAEFTSYYGKPIINPPVWEARDIAGYFFLGGLAGGSSLLAAGADLTGRTGLSRAAKAGAFAAATLSVAALVHDLGRPARFVNMMRVFKVTSPMSVGSWLLGGYVPAAGVAAATTLSGRLPRLGTAATTGAAVLGPAVAAGRGGAYVKAGEFLAVIGAAGAALSGIPAVTTGRYRRAVAGASGAALIGASAATRWGVFHAGLASAQDPKYTVIPQRKRLDARTADEATEKLARQEDEDKDAKLPARGHQGRGAAGDSAAGTARRRWPRPGRPRWRRAGQRRPGR